MTGLRALLNNVHARGEALRYLTVVAVGSVVDLSIAWTAHEILGVQIIAAAALGFVIASVLSYFVHEFWTFRSAGSGFSATRLGKFGAASAVTLTMRMTLVWISAPLSSLPFGSLARLMFSLAGSLLVGFAINRVLVFGRRPGF